MVQPKKMLFFWHQYSDVWIQQVGVDDMPHRDHRPSFLGPRRKPALLERLPPIAGIFNVDGLPILRPNIAANLKLHATHDLIHDNACLWFQQVVGNLVADGDIVPLEVKLFNIHFSPSPLGAAVIFTTCFPFDTTTSLGGMPGSITVFTPAMLPSPLLAR